MRNPIGQEEYTGAWNNEDEERWSKEFKKQVNFDKTQGYFYMTVEDFKRAF